uniref:Uncharacterized protein n=1 Tax=Romanomermis culicivorax TaxID=13658 RepID=A0A915KSU3_ROMCU
MSFLAENGGFKQKVSLHLFSAFNKLQQTFQRICAPVSVYLLRFYHVAHIVGGPSITFAARRADINAGALTQCLAFAIQRGRETSVCLHCCATVIEQTTKFHRNFKNLCETNDHLLCWTIATQERATKN